MIADKNIIGQRFHKNKKTYNKHAVVQKEIALKLVQKIINAGETRFDKILEMGCGTGFLTDEILKHMKIGRYYINDLVHSMISEIEKIAEKNNYHNFTFLPGDAEKMLFPEELDAVISASTFHWFENLESFFEKIFCAVKKGGLFAFSTFGPENFKEVKDTAKINLNYQSSHELTRLLLRNFTVIDMEEWTRVEYFKSPDEVLKHMKYTGVNSLQKKYFGKDKYIRFCADYTKNYSTEDHSVSLTYNPIIVIARNR